MRWFEHINRIGDRIRTFKRRKKGRLRRTWTEEAALEKRCSKREEVKQKTQDKKEWKSCGGKNRQDNSTPTCFTPEKVERHQD
jgi:hypothetical protein